MRFAKISLVAAVVVSAAGTAGLVGTGAIGVAASSCSSTPSWVRSPWSSAT